MNQSDSFERILAVLQEAALHGAAWHQADRLISKIAGTNGSALMFVEAKSPAAAAVLLAEFSFFGRRREDWERRYFRHYWLQDERVPRVIRLPSGRVVRTRDLYTAREKQTSATYNEALPELKWQNGLQVRLDGPQGSHVSWTTSDTTQPGGWGSDQIGLIERLAPHVRQFAVVRHTLAEAGVEGTSVTRLLDNTRVGAIYLDRRGRILTTNDRALGILRQGDRLLDRDDLLCARSPTENSELSRLLARAVPPFGARGSAGSMMIGRSSATPLALHVTPVCDGYPSCGKRRIAALVMVVDPAGRASVDPGLVQAALGLTAAESRLAVALAAGDTLQDIARASGGAEATGRRLLEEILRKQGISREMDLVRRVLTLEGFPHLSG
ncbi:helix-turn-helix transcriptional regulator [Candidatus Palauibacter sp.]|uniref:helix-turn-helix transcriptional regulator n=1 Tax=Candidatus Palauibacter sp. TaxID=3101350 RepID=UPI003B51C609